MLIQIVEFNWEGDGVTALYLDGKLHTHGDYYHDKIDDWIKGFLAGLKFMGVEYTNELWRLSYETKLGNAVGYCGKSPPKRFATLKNKGIEKSEHVSYWDA